MPKSFIVVSRAPTAFHSFQKRSGKAVDCSLDEADRFATAASAIATAERGQLTDWRLMSV